MCKKKKKMDILDIVYTRKSIAYLCRTLCARNLTSACRKRMRVRQPYTAAMVCETLPAEASLYSRQPATQIQTRQFLKTVSIPARKGRDYRPDV